MEHGFVINEHDNLVFLTVPALSACRGVVHAYTTRRGGVSVAPYGSLNMGLHVGDEPDQVITNRKRVCRLLGADISQMVAGQQVHGAKVVTVGTSFCGRGSLFRDDAIPGVDALVTAEPGVLLSSYYADCVPLFFTDPVRKVVALAHAGWKGTVLRIGAATVQHMRKEHGCEAGDIIAAIGPSIGPCCYEVDAPVMKKVEQCLPGYAGFARPGGPGKWWLNLPEINRRVLLEAGIRPANITVAGYCTACRKDLFFSHRGESGRTGRMASLIMLTGG